MNNITEVLRVLGIMIGSIGGILVVISAISLGARDTVELPISPMMQLANPNIETQHQDAENKDKKRLRWGLVALLTGLILFLASLGLPALLL
jgi:hypothetical protein